jgi:hypothetical protein
MLLGRLQPDKKMAAAIIDGIIIIFFNIIFEFLLLDLYSQYIKEIGKNPDQSRIKAPQN